MKIKVYVPTYIFKSPYLRETKIECTGTGIEDDPAIVEPSENLPPSFIIADSALFVRIRNCNLHNISLRMSQNIVVEDCKLKYSHLKNSSKIEYINTSIEKFIALYNCTNIKVKKCNIGKLKLYQSSSNIIKDSIIDKIKTTSSKDNVFESISSPEVELSKLKKTHFADFADRLKLKSLIVSIIIFLLVVIFLPIIAFGTFIDLPFFIFLLALFIFLFYFVDFIRTRARKQNKYEKD